MANDISANPWKLDTASANTIYSSPVRIGNIIWSNVVLAATTGSATLVITDVNAKDIVRITLTNTLGTVTQTQVAFVSGQIGWVRGIIMTTLSSAGGTAGEVTIAIGAGK